MKNADNFNASKWLVENKITTQSKLNEGIVTAPLSNFLWKLNPKVKEWENISSTKEALSFIKSLTNEELNNLYAWRLGFDIPQSEDEKIKNLLDLIDNKIGESNLKEAEGKSKNDLLSLITNNQAKVAKEIGAVRLEDIMIDDLEDVGATAIFKDGRDEMRGGVAFRYSENVDDDFEGENGDEPRPIEIAGKQLMYIGYNI